MMPVRFDEAVALNRQSVSGPPEAATLNASIHIETIAARRSHGKSERDEEKERVSKGRKGGLAGHLGREGVDGVCGTAAKEELRSRVETRGWEQERKTRNQ
ncbi:hypothetical protein KQX54_021541 [Cotesia glomerata]|uniref:Uncharacterized protein n=1 Tax=Cotesia glomerata TaxID=32391 RepID=A0AAV7J7N5_COTGL|nr:hypothetical protein KQX54_021541 [Cotesia glomerata]